ncbi:GNAT family N-acetyltransferase [Ciceribacter sp. RN22]|uniref:GNAT family N-acetyltransferase n=1 Tax=Ciceribacter sp. RN22 TaxID=2954932 RepID=UPI002092D366|nr:GNAT family N-acetyltransferase [Ciceribacter sp. RN22]MCO6176963.1 GNAT family N-acetyltransferase [Ciceribacter sp. RN22]
MAIQIARIDDHFERYDELLQVILSAFAYMEGVVDPPSSATRLTPQVLQDKSGSEIAYVALEGDQIVGCVFLRPEPPETLYVGKLAVLPDAQGKGVGARLLMLAEQIARAEGLCALRLEVRVELTRNRSYFAGYGFVKTAENRHPGFDRTTSIEMRKALS